MEIDHAWSVKTGAYGKRLRRRLPPDVWSALEATYVGSGAEDNWNALFVTLDLMRRVGMEVGAALGYAYPEHQHQRVIAYLRRMPASARRWPRALALLIAARRHSMATDIAVRVERVALEAFCADVFVRPGTRPAEDARIPAGRAGGR